MARPTRWQERFTFGGNLPWGVGLVLSLTVGLSLIVAFGSRHTAPFFHVLSLRPGDVWNGELWRLVTWPFVELGPLALIFSCLFLFWFGRDLALDWGSPRFLSVFAGIMGTAGVVTCLVALVDRPLMAEEYTGGWAATSAMTVAWGLWFPDRLVRIYLIIPIRGFWLAWLTVGCTIIYAVYMGWENFVPQLVAEWSTVGWLYRGVLVARWRRRQKARENERRFAEKREAQAAAKKRAKGVDYLRLVERDDADPPRMPKDVEDRVSDLLEGRTQAPRSKRKPGDGEDSN
jgi:membrane associated rhomboid family serine protease